MHFNNSRIFQYISSIKGNNWYPTPIFYNDKQASTDSDKAQLFNKYFYSVYTSSKQQINDCERTANPDMLQDITISEYEVFKIFTSVSSSKACGISTQSNHIQKLCCTSIPSCLSLVFHNSTITLSHRNGLPIVWSLFTKPGTNHLYSIIDLFPYFVFSPKYHCLQ